MLATKPGQVFTWEEGSFAEVEGRVSACICQACWARWPSSDEAQRARLEMLMNSTRRQALGAREDLAHEAIEAAQLREILGLHRSRKAAQHLQS